MRRLAVVLALAAALTGAAASHAAVDVGATATALVAGTEDTLGSAAAPAGVAAEAVVTPAAGAVQDALAAPSSLVETAATPAAAVAGDAATALDLASSTTGLPASPGDAGVVQAASEVLQRSAKRPVRRAAGATGTAVRTARAAAAPVVEPTLALVEGAAQAAGERVAPLLGAAAGTLGAVRAGPGADPGPGADDGEGERRDRPSTSHPAAGPGPDRAPLGIEGPAGPPAVVAPDVIAPSAGPVLAPPPVAGILDTPGHAPAASAGDAPQDSQAGTPYAGEVASASATAGRPSASSRAPGSSAPLPPLPGAGTWPSAPAASSSASGVAAAVSLLAVLATLAFAFPRLPGLRRRMQPELAPSAASVPPLERPG